LLILRANGNGTTDLVPHFGGILHLKFTLEQDTAEQQTLKSAVHPLKKRKYI